VAEDGVTIGFYDDPLAESTLRMGPSGGALVFVSNVAHVSSHVENGLDEQTKGGSNFGRSKFLGIKPAAFTVTFVVLADEDAAFWKSVAPLLRQKGKKGAAPPMAVVNPQINRWGVDTVTVVSADVDAPDARDGRQVTIHLKEWTPAPVKPVDTTSGVVNRDPLNLAPGAAAKNQ
jgi:hypothetical protein